EPLEIALCAQHNNGGLGIDVWWQTDLTGFFAVGEVSGSHGVYRPGGSALNAGQVGSTRAAQYIARNREGLPVALAEFREACQDQLSRVIALSEAVVGDAENVRLIWDETTKRMSRHGAAIRNRQGIAAALDAVGAELAGFNQKVCIKRTEDLSKVFRLYDTLICQYVYLAAMVDYIDADGKSRGSSLYTTGEGSLPYANLPEIFRFVLDDGLRGDLVQEVRYHKGKCRFSWRKVREIPAVDDFFENVWRDYRENGNVY
ncbi:MAG TPA: oxidoreductase, partial [Bacillota bacterium]|nr:oxidoreductase [Bacillota bacterium]